MPYSFVLCLIVLFVAFCAIRNRRAKAADKVKYHGDYPGIGWVLLLAVLLATPAQAKPGDRIKALIAKITHHADKEPTPAEGVSQDQPEATRPQRSLLSPRGRAVRQQPAASHPDAPAAPADEPAPKTSTKPTAGLSSDESRLVAGLNGLRAARGVAPATVDPVLMEVAREQLSDPRYTPHHSPRYGSSAQHAARYANFTSVNDVVSAGQWSDGSRCTPEQSCDAWRQSDGHLRCILGQSNINNRWIDEGYDCVGVARGPKFDLAVFGRRAESNHRESTAAVQRGAIVVVAPLSTPCISRFAECDHEPSFTEAGVILRKVKANAGNLNVANDGQPHMLANTRRAGEVDAMSHRRILPDKKCECQSGGECHCINCQCGKGK